MEGESYMVQPDAPHGKTMTGKVKFSGYHKFLIVMLSAATFFEGYDYMVINLILPLMGKEYGVSTQTLGYTVGLINVGTIVAFFIIRTADRFGRKPILLVTIVVYTVFSVLTAFSRSLFDFAIYQFFARVFLVTEWGLAAVILAEELPAAKRAFGIAIVQLCAAAGSIISAVLYPTISASGFGWRGLYLVGIVPLFIIIWLRRRMKETQRWIQSRENCAKRESPQQGFFEVLKSSYRKRTVLLMMLWFLSWVPLTAVQVFWAYYAINERGWTLGGVSKAMSIAYGIGLTGYLVSGKLMDKLGRKPTSFVFFLGAAISIFWAFTASQTTHMYISIGLCVFFVTSFLPISSTYTTELFPTHLRANAAAWTNNTLGRVGCVVAPALTGYLAAILGSIGNAVAALSVAPLVAAFLILFFFPETKQRELEEISNSVNKT
jgi:MFS transporter, putative metabolite:H+ symporter